MKKILLSLFGIITLGLINFSSAIFNNYSFVVSGNTFQGITPTTRSLNITNSSWFGNSFTLDFNFYSTFSNVCFFAPLTYTGSNDLSGTHLLKCPSLSGNPSVYRTNTYSTLISDYSCIDLGTFNYFNGIYTNNALLTEDSYCFYTNGINNHYVITRDDNLLYNSPFTIYYYGFNNSSICSSFQSDLQTCQSSLSTCQSDLTTCQNSSSSCSPSGQCLVSDKLNENIIFSGSKSFSSAGYTNVFNYGTEGAGTYCMKFTSSNPQTLTMGFANGGTTAPTNLYSLYNDQYGNTICLYGNKPYLNVKLNSSSNTIDYEVYKLTDLLSDDIPCEEIQGEECTQLKCENDYNLIPESSINSEYCEENFGLIDPENCPASGGTGDVQWSSFFVNSHQVQGASNIYLWLPDFLNWDYTYVDSGSTLEIDVENEGDEDYIQGIIDVNSYRPTNEEFIQSFVGGLTLLMPYIVIVLFVVAVWGLIKKIFKH